MSAYTGFKLFEREDGMGGKQMRPGRWKKRFYCCFVLCLLMMSAGFYGGVASAAEIGESCNNNADCDDDTVYCNGVPSCSAANSTCVAGTAPCTAGETCNEGSDRCDECTGDCRLY